MEQPIATEVKVESENEKVESTTAGLPALKDGARSSEFWLAVLVAALAAAGIVSGKVPPEWGVSLSGILVIAHAKLRTGLKERHLDLAADLIDTALAGPHLEAVNKLSGQQEITPEHIAAIFKSQGGEVASRDAHNVETAGSIPAPAIK